MSAKLRVLADNDVTRHYRLEGSVMNYAGLLGPRGLNQKESVLLLLVVVLGHRLRRGVGVQGDVAELAPPGTCRRSPCYEIALVIASFEFNLNIN